MSAFNRLTIQPRLLNSACPWASTLDDLQALYLCPHTGAVTTRTATLHGFPDDPEMHQVAFASGSVTSVNSYGYSPFPLKQYVEWVGSILGSYPDSNKPIIISITASISDEDHGGAVSTDSLDDATRGDDTTDTISATDSAGTVSPHSDELKNMIDAIQTLRKSLQDSVSASPRIAVEINTSCPNIQGHPPPAYEPDSLRPLVNTIAKAVEQDRTLAVGLKLPPYVYHKQFVDVVDFLSSFSKSDGESTAWNPIAFLTCTNTLGTSILFQSETTKRSDSLYALPTVSGGLAGEAVHPLSLGNVHTFATLLKEHTDEALRRIPIIGVGGVTSPAAVERMVHAGAYVVGCATALGRQGVGVFEELAKALTKET